MPFGKIKLLFICSFRFSTSKRLIILPINLLLFSIFPSKVLLIEIPIYLYLFLYLYNCTCFIPVLYLFTCICFVPINCIRQTNVLLNFLNLNFLFFFSSFPFSYFYLWLTCCSFYSLAFSMFLLVCLFFPLHVYYILIFYV